MNLYFDFKWTYLTGKILTITIALCITYGVKAQATKATFSPFTYTKLLNTKAGEVYDTIKNARIDAAAESGYYLKKGKNTLTIKGREPGACLEHIWIGAPGSSPITSDGVSIDIKSAHLKAPMRMENGMLVSESNSGAATFEFDIENEGNYFFWGKAWGPDTASNSFFISVNNAPEIVWDIPKSRQKNTTWKIMKGRGLDYFSAWNFLLSWGACSPESTFRNNQEFRELAFNLLKVSIDGIGRRKVQPAQLWFLEDLEALRLWQLDLRSPQENDEFSAMLKKMRVFVENCYNMTQTPNGWRENTPNIQIQAAAILTLGAEMWKTTDPETSEKWTRAASECIDRAWKWKMPDSPFRYSYGSGIDANYFSGDAMHLSCIYRLNRDKRIENALRDMAAMATNCTAGGIPVSLGSPWWKHTCNSYNRNNGNSMLPVQVLATSGNQTYAKLIELDKKRHLREPYPYTFQWLVPFYNSQFPEFSNPVAKISNESFYSSIENGPMLRSGEFTTAMPWQSWCESTAGAFYSNSEQVISQLCSIIITAVEPRVEHANAKAHYPLAYSVVEMSNPVPQARDTVIDKDFIAGATSFRPALAGPALPEFVNKKNDSPWLRTDIWFANADGMAGVLELQALKDNSCTRVALWTHISEKAQIKSANISVKGITVILDEQFSGKIRNMGKTWGYSAGYYPLDLLEYVFKESANGFKQGETFSTTVSVKRDDGATLTVGAHGKDGAIRHAQILRNGKDYVKLIFNSGKTTTTYNGMEIQSGKLKVLKSK